MMMVMGADNVSITMSLKDNISNGLDTILQQLKKLERQMDNTVKSMSNDAKSMQSDASKTADTIEKKCITIKRSLDQVSRKSVEAAQKAKASLMEQQMALEQVQKAMTSRPFQTASSMNIAHSASVDKLVKSYKNQVLQLGEAIDFTKKYDSSERVLHRHQKARLLDHIKLLKTVDKEANRVPQFKYNRTALPKYMFRSSAPSGDINLQEALIPARRDTAFSHFSAGLSGMHSNRYNGGMGDIYTAERILQEKQQPVFSAGMVAATTVYGLMRFTQSVLKADEALQEVFRQADWGNQTTRRREYAALAGTISAKYGQDTAQINAIATSILKSGIIKERADGESTSDQIKNLNTYTDKIAKTAMILQTDPQKLVDIVTQSAIAFANNDIMKPDKDGIMRRTGKKKDIQGSLDEMLGMGEYDTSVLDIINYVDKMAKGKTDVDKILTVMQKGTQWFANMNMSQAEMAGMAGFLSQFQPHAGVEEKTFRSLSELMSMKESELKKSQYEGFFQVLRSAKGNEKFSLAVMKQIKDEHGFMPAFKYLSEAFARKFKNKDGSIDQGALANSLKSIKGEYGARIASLMLGVKIDDKGNFIKDKNGKYMSLAPGAGNSLNFMQNLVDKVKSGEVKKDAEGEFNKSMMSISTQVNRFSAAITGIAATIAATLDPIIVPLLKGIVDFLQLIPKWLEKHATMVTTSFIVLIHLMSIFAMRTVGGYVEKAFQWIPGQLGNMGERLGTLQALVKQLLTVVSKDEFSLEPGERNRAHAGVSRLGGVLSYAAGTTLNLAATIGLPLLLGQTLENLFGGDGGKAPTALGKKLYQMMGGKLETDKNGNLTEESLSEYKSAAYGAATIATISFLPFVTPVVNAITKGFLDLSANLWTKNLQPMLVSILAAIRGNTVTDAAGDIIGGLMGRSGGKGFRFGTRAMQLGQARAQRASTLFGRSVRDNIRDLGDSWTGARATNNPYLTRGAIKPVPTGAGSYKLSMWGKILYNISNGITNFFKLDIFRILRRRLDIITTIIAGIWSGWGTIVGWVTAIGAMLANPLALAGAIVGAILAIPNIIGLAIMGGYKGPKDPKHLTDEEKQKELVRAEMAKTQELFKQNVTRLMDRFNELGAAIMSWWNSPDAIKIRAEANGKVKEFVSWLGKLALDSLYWSLVGINNILSASINALDGFNLWIKKITGQLSDKELKNLELKQEFWRTGIIPNEFKLPGINSPTIVPVKTEDRKIVELVFGGLGPGVTLTPKGGKLPKGVKVGKINAGFTYGNLGLNF